jgi:hypothetical protein
LPCALCLVALSGCVVIDRDDYVHSAPLRKAKGCPQLAGTYIAATQEGSDSPYEAFNLIGHLVSTDSAATARWQGAWSKSPIRLTIAGDTDREIVLTARRDGVPEPVFAVTQVRSRGDYDCEPGFVVYRTPSYWSDGEVGAGYRTYGMRLGLAEDGALALRVDSTYTGTALIVPGYMNTRSWMFLPPDVAVASGGPGPATRPVPGGPQASGNRATWTR